MTTTLISIVNGPSKFDLMNSLFLRKPDHHEVNFKAQDGAVYKATIDACAAEDGSGECWNISGRAITFNGRIETLKHFRGFFCTNVRTGHLKFVD